MHQRVEFFWCYRPKWGFDALRVGQSIRLKGVTGEKTMEEKSVIVVQNVCMLELKCNFETENCIVYWYK